LQRKNLQLCLTLDDKNKIETNYQANSQYLQLLKKCAHKRTHGGHLFLSLVKLKVLERDLRFFFDHGIIKKKDEFQDIGRKEGIAAIDRHKNANIFLFDGILKETDEINANEFE